MPRKLLILIMLFTFACAEELPQAIAVKQHNDYVYYYHGDSLKSALLLFAKSNNLKVEFSDDLAIQALKKPVSGRFAVASKEQLLNTLGSQYGFNWFYYSGTLYVCSTQYVNRSINVNATDLPAIKRSLKEVGLYSSQFGYTEIANENRVIVNGPRAYTDLVAKYISQLGVSTSAQQFAVYRLKYANAADIQLSFNGQPIVIPGIATILQSLLNTGQMPAGSSNIISPQVAEPIKNQLSQLTPLNSQHGVNQNPASGFSESASGVISNPIVQADARLNSVIIRGSTNNLQIYQNLIKMLDIPSPMIQVEVLIIHLNQDDLEDAGINWWASSSGSAGGFGAANLAQNSPTNNLSYYYNQVNPGQLLVTNMGSFATSLQFLEQKKLAQTVGRPSLATSDNIPAIVNVVENLFVNGTNGINNNQNNVNYNLYQAQISQSLQITPHLIIDDNNRQQIKLSVTLQDGVLNDSNNVFPNTTQSTITSQALITEGQSILLAGYTREVSREVTTQVPFLGSIPLLGWFFKSTTNKKQKIATIYLVTPKVVNMGDLYKLKDYVAIDGNSFNIKNTYQIVPKESTEVQQAISQTVESRPIVKAPIPNKVESTVLIVTKGPTTANEDIQVTNQAVPDNANYVIVRPNDTLYSIARQYAISPTQLQQCNNLHTQTIKVGQKLKICH